MSPTRHSEVEIAAVLGQLEQGTPLRDVCGRHGVSEAATKRWQAYFGRSASDRIKCIKQLKAENARLRRIVAQQAMDVDALREIVAKNWPERSR